MSETNGRSPRATIKDVAKAAGVSRSTVSRALTGNGYVAAEIRDRVQAAAEKLAYIPDATARSLRQRESRIIGVLISDLRNPFYADLAAGVGQAVRAAGYTMVLLEDRDESASELAAVEQLLELRVAGVIMTPLAASSVEYLVANEVPVVEVDRQAVPGKCDAVVVDNRAAARDLTTHLTRFGHRRIALIADRMYWTTGKDRAAGYRDALRAAGLEPDPALVVDVGLSVESVRAQVRRLMCGANPPTALFAVNNVVAEGAHRALVQLGLTLPDDVSLASFDDAPWMSMVTPGITAAAQDVPALGSLAAERLLARIVDPSAPVQKVVLTAPVLARGSTGPAHASDSPAI